MSTLNVLESFFPVKSMTGMDLAKGVPESRSTESASRSKDGASFEGILEDEVQSQASTDGSLISENESPRGENTDVGSTGVDEETSQKEDSAINDERSIESGQDAISILTHAPMFRVDPALEARSGEEPLQAIKSQAPESASLADVGDVLRMDDSVKDSAHAEDLAGEAIESLGLSVDSQQSQGLWQAASMESLKVSASQMQTVAPLLASDQQKSGQGMSDVESEVGAVISDLEADAAHAARGDLKDLLESSLGDSAQESWVGSETLEPELAKPVSLRSFVDELFVHKNLLEGGSPKAEMLDEQTLGLTQDHSHVKTQVLREMKPMISNLLVEKMGGEMTIQLKPMHLGHVKVDVKVVEDAVRVNFQAESPAARLQLQSQALELKTHLQAAGLKVEHIQFSSMQAHEGSRQGDSRQPFSHHQQSQESRHQQQAPHDRRSQDDSQRFWDQVNEESSEARL